MITCLGDTLVALWLWNMTWGLYYIPVSLFAMVLLVWRMTCRNLFQSFFWAFCSVMTAYLAFFLFVLCMVFLEYGHAEVPAEVSCSYTMLWGIHPAFGIALLYSCLELLFLRYTPLWRIITPLRLTIITLLANGLAALIGVLAGHN